MNLTPDFISYFQVKESFSSSTSASVAEVKALTEAFQEIVSTNPNPTAINHFEQPPVEKFESTSTSESISSSSKTLLVGGEGDQNQNQAIDQKPPPSSPVERKEIQEENIKNALKEIISEIDKVVGSSEAEFSSSQSQKPQQQQQQVVQELQQKLQQNKENIPQGQRNEATFGQNEGGGDAGGAPGDGGGAELTADDLSFQYQYKYQEEDGYGQEHQQNEQVR